MDPAAHPAGVVGDHAADAGDVSARRVGSEPSPVAGEAPVDVAEHDARLDAHAARPSSSTLHPLPVAAHVEQDPVGLRLAAEARAAGAEDERRGGAPREREQLARRPRRRAGSRRPRDRAVGARVGGVADQVERARRDAPRARAPRVSSLRSGSGVPARDPVGRAVGCGRGPRARSRVRRARPCERSGATSVEPHP